MDCFCFLCALLLLIFVHLNAQMGFGGILLTLFIIWTFCKSVPLLQIDRLDLRGIQLAALFMSGVDMALFANDACGQPIPWEHCCPWMYFDGKLLQSKLIRTHREKAQLIDLCDGQVTSCSPHT